jgi:hypothetical protein
MNEERKKRIRNLIDYSRVLVKCVEKKLEEVQKIIYGVEEFLMDEEDQKLFIQSINRASSSWEV